MMDGKTMGIVSGKPIAGIIAVNVGLGNGVNLTHEEASALVAWMTKVEKDSLRLDKLREMIGYVQGGTDRTISLSEDDATNDICINTNVNHSSSGRTIGEAIDNFKMLGEYK